VVRDVRPARVTTWLVVLTVPPVCRPRAGLVPYCTREALTLSAFHRISAAAEVMMVVLTLVRTGGLGVVGGVVEAETAKTRSSRSL
jgi:hypothetical protein